MYGQQQTKCVEVINRVALSLPAPKPCPVCEKEGADTCYWEKDKDKSGIKFDNRCLKKNELNIQNEVTYKRITYCLKETKNIYLQRSQNL